LLRFASLCFALLRFASLRSTHNDKRPVILRGTQRSGVEAQNPSVPFSYLLWSLVNCDGAPIPQGDNYKTKAFSVSGLPRGDKAPLAMTDHCHGKVENGI
jgi:hypothetical protein